MIRSRLGALALLTALAGLVLTIVAGPASAHAFLVASNPSDGAVLAKAPSALRLDFSESVVLGATAITVTDSAGHSFDPTSLRLVTGRGTEEPAHVVADLPALRRSAYRVSWRTLSSDDLHATSGVLVFGVEAAVTATPFVEPTPRPDEATLRWLLFASLAAALGALLVRRLHRRTRPGVPDERIERVLRRLATIGAGTGLLAAVLLLILALAGTGASLGQLLSGGYGERWALREAGFGLLLAAAWRVRTPEPDRAHSVLVGAGAFAACVGSALLGHSAGFASTRIVADAAHLAAAATWSGALLAIAVVLLRPGTNSGAFRLVLRAFAVPAAACVSVVIVTGVYLTSGVVGSVDAALLTMYGRTLVLKIALVAVAGGLALVSTTRLHGSARRPVPRRTILAEAVLALVVLALAALLTSGQPAREPQFVAATTARVVPALDTGVADLQEALALSPNRPGRSVVLVGVFDTRRPAPAPVAGVFVDIAGADGRFRGPIAAEPLGNGRWSAATDLAESGPLRVRVTVQRPGLPVATQDYSWVVGGAPRVTRHAVLSTAPVGAALQALTVVLAGLIGVAWAVAWRRRAGRTAARALPPELAPATASDEGATG